MTKTAVELEAFDSRVLCDALARARTGATAGDVRAGLFAGGRMTTATLDSSGMVNPDPSAACMGPIGCIAKLLTGALTLRAGVEGRVDFSRSPTESELPLLHPWLQGTTLRHLLSHSHGLDLSGLRRLSLTPAGRIDVAVLAERLRQSRRLFEPGALYSYNNAGCWLTAVLLERAYSTRFAELLASKVLAPAGVHREDHNNAWCPSTGGALRLSVPELLRVFESFLAHQESYRPELRVPIAPPGWCLERGSCAGLKYYGSGWYGHHMVTGPHSLAVRLHFERRIAIAVAARDTSRDSAGTALLRVFGRFLPEFTNMRVPKAVGGTIPPAEAARCIGIYADEAMIARVTADERGGLLLELFAGANGFRDDPPQMRAPLVPGTDGAYLAGSLPLDFLSLTGTGYRYIWNGRQVLRRIEASRSGTQIAGYSEGYETAE